MDRIVNSNPTDEELDRDWKPSGRRPQSTIARSFSAELMDIFRIENSVADLDEKVDKRKQQLNTQTNELEALEARIREMEERLKQNPSGPSPRQARMPIRDIFGEQAAPPPVEKDLPVRGAPAGEHPQKYNRVQGRPGTARASQQAVPGALPPSPVASEDGDDERRA